MSSPKRNMKSLGLVLVRLAPYASKPPKARPLARDMILPGRGGEGRGGEGRGGEGRGEENRNLVRTYDGGGGGLKSLPPPPASFSTQSIYFLYSVM